MYTISTETPADEYEVEALYDLCFAPGRTALSSYRLREGVEKVADLCLLLREEHGILLAAIRFWPVRIGNHYALLLGPIAVHPTAQGEGLGAILMRDSLARAQKAGWGRVLLVGDAPYYSRFGFSRLDGIEMPPPTNPDRVLGLELREGSWVGIRGTVCRAQPPALAGDDVAPHIRTPEPERPQPKDGHHGSQAAGCSSADHRPDGA
ncbi:Predicted N-acetyltransferase YhbS [Paracoccus seriniphilus]|uniref:Predicted N-acetyltransferase YhbS n=1 Tax=Paracoccus seriniphilus TaxID=184748 RepID=A0A239PYB5_9RHOB|nr:N-acetyltransferase [Paracoccus seriniphilus]SNT75160.1 Predicted N-acetyltransferase YhbS [Paracoccus seriniphilus]